ncbi:hypothetical protein CGLO_08321 [Colletotrichum gloeosporioides Cg-14]|uniref:Secreted protein n=1 Tax=Colletotrichum gloeosporioides (strain Cg-14) TaxID=1237896 RepID=T0KIR1_COLGC|nr:hypothetical protein CGLO_08321 [Colletotrichum gloeosporioides Cg-14]
MASWPQALSKPASSLLLAWPVHASTTFAACFRRLPTLIRDMLRPDQPSAVTHDAQLRHVFYCVHSNADLLDNISLSPTLFTTSAFCQLTRDDVCGTVGCQLSPATGAYRKRQGCSSYSTFTPSEAMVSGPKFGTVGR